MNSKKAQALIIVIAVIVIILIGIGFYYFNKMNSPIIGGVSQTGLSSGSSTNTGTNTASNPTNTVTDNPQTNTNPGTTNTKQTYNIKIQSFAFVPGTLTIKTGDTIIWTNMDSVGHTVTSDSGSELDSSLLSQGNTYSNTFTKTGTYDYHCTPHPNMKGTVIVE